MIKNWIQPWADKALHELRLFAIAVQFLTRLPIPQWVGFEPQWLSSCARHFPLVGCLVASVGAVVWLAAHALFTPLVAAWLSIAATVYVTGGFHEDGWADTCDGLGGAVSKERALEIMKDSRIGAYGAMGLVLMLSLKAATLSALSPVHGLMALLLAHSASRSAVVGLIRILAYAGDADHAKAKPLAQKVSSKTWRMAVLWSVLLGLGLVVCRPQSWIAICLSAIITLLLTTWCAHRLQKRLGGFVGDTLGAAQQLLEVGVLLTWLAWQQIGR
jgi:adenosylcobinamide-GDP ribazoletransferase